MENTTDPNPTTSPGADNSVALPQEIPRQVNFYVAGYSKKFWIGLHEEEKLFAALLRGSYFSRIDLCLHNGPSKQDPVMVASSQKGSTYTLTLATGPEPLDVTGRKVKGDGVQVLFERHGSRKYGFKMDVPLLAISSENANGDDNHPDSTEESRSSLAEFEWRQAKSASEWLLMGPGEETFATWKPNKRSWRKLAYFEFVGRAVQANAMGIHWELTALLTPLLIWHYEHQD